MSKKLDCEFLAVNKDYFKLGLNPTQILILSQIDEFNRNTGDCYISDEKLALMFGISKSTVSREIKALESKGYITKETKNVKGGKERHIKINREATKVNLSVDGCQNVGVVDTQTSNCLLSNVNLPIVNKQNDFIKDNIKDKEKENKSVMNQPQVADIITQSVRTEVINKVINESTAEDGSFKY